MNPLRSIALTLAGLAVLTVSACGGSSGGSSGGSGSSPAEDEEGQAELSVVTSTDVYADLISQIGGDAVEVQALVTSTATDPHSYEATPQDRLAVENADVIIANGAGYDSFITQLASAAEKEDAVHQVAEGSAEHDHDHSHDHEDGDSYQNEHLWYDLARMEQFVLEVAEHLGQLAPQHAELYAEGAEELAEQIGALDERSQQLQASGHSYLATEAVSGYLLEHAGFDNRTDPAFLSAVEHGDDVSPRLYRDALQRSEEVDLLSYNAQTETQQASRIRDAAQEASAVVVEFTETIPEDSAGYLEWMESNIDTLEAALQEAQ
ncbi:zinc ABC transporter substrate-binding protein [Garicola koreensis]|nr:zinc ABC transporter substrate-binding protein [Garicola koreensis]